MSNQEIKSKVDMIFTTLTKVETKVESLIDRFDGLNVAQGFLETHRAKHEVRLDHHDNEIKELKTSLGSGGDGDIKRWASLAEFFSGLPRYLKVIAWSIAGLSSLIMLIYEFLKRTFH